ncbi:MAG TPA: reverse transcriptase family protein [Ideonella sp.]|uniref:reverse transcriptase family protein n=1 Tax=Ideonella sp. TaxID=1929293 RepID=UPI002E30D25D|nr:reverse transcriptase family protein [Ideonella sp.]HEX5684592.1 reverse transcriptase family protein [Ideonella sp.]
MRLLIALALLYLAWKLFRIVQRRLDRYRPPPRDISRLARDDDDDASAELTERIDLSGAPLKEHHLRRGWRDKRLLPKRKRGWDEPKPPKVMSMDEATRLFSGTLRTRNRHIRDLAIDAEQLERHGLPVWRSEADVAAALGISEKKLRHYAIHRQRERVSHYVSFAIPKRRGGERVIMAPKTELKALQRKLNTLLVAKLPVSDCAHGFRPGRSIATNAAPHAGKPVVLKLDIQDFFPSLHVGRVRGLLISFGYAYPVAAGLAALMTESERQPVVVDNERFHVPIGSRHAVQGAPTSPGLANALALRLDRRLDGLAKAHGFVYTRYADDLAFSGDDVEKARQLIKRAESIVRDEGFRLNRDKTRVMTQASGQRVAGVTVNTAPGWSRKQRRQLRAELHRARTSGATDPSLWQRLRGKLAFVRMLNPAQAERMEKPGNAESPPTSP